MRKRLSRMQHVGFEGRHGNKKVKISQRVLTFLCVKGYVFAKFETIV